MNIFYLNSDPVQAARDLCDQHVTKMLLEGSQQLAAAHHLTGGRLPDGFPKLTHRNHPSTIWTRSSIHHYRWLAEHTVEICEEFNRRFGKLHSWDSISRWFLENAPDLPDIKFEEPPQVVDSYMMVDGNAVLAYRRYYREKKSAFARWRHSPTPEWW